MKRTGLFILVILLAAIATFAVAQVRDYTPVTQQMLLNPSPDDWLMFSRTYDAQRFSPLNQIDTKNVGQLAVAWSHPMGTGTTESIPLVHQGVMYVLAPGSIVEALDATNGKLLWEYKRAYASAATGTGGRSKNLAIFEDMIYFTAPDSYVVALDARTGAVRWETKADARSHTSGPIVVEGKVLAGGGCGGARANCYIGAYDAKTGKELWRFYTVAGKDDPEGDASWGGAPEDRRSASTWGLAGSYDPVRRLVYWGIANPTPNTRSARHGGNSNAIPLTAPADLYSNSTVALNPDTGKLAWYYQHLPGDDWDEDINEERVLLRTPINPDPKFVKWINPDIPKGQPRDISVNIGEGGGIWALDRGTGQFLWASPFPYDVPNFILSNIDVKTGKATINEELIVDQPGERHTVCFFNTRSYWPTAYIPSKNSLYVPFIDNCLDMTSAAAPAQPAAQAPAPAAPAQAGQAGPGRGAPGGAAQQAAPGGVPPAPADGRGAAAAGRGAAGGAGAAGGGRGGRGGGEVRRGIARPGADPKTLNGLAKINMSTGEVLHFNLNPVPATSAVLATAGDLIFHGDINQMFHAFDADTGKLLWETKLGGSISVGTITYAVNGKQYVAVTAGSNLAIPGLISGTMGPVAVPITPVTNHNEIYVFALPDKK